MSADPLHARSQRLINMFVDAPSHACMVHGMPGTNINEAADSMAGKIANSKDIDKTRIRRLEPKNGTIGIDQFAEYRSHLKYRQPDGAIVIIKNIDHATHEAQNSMLKLLEEPPTNTYFILTAYSRDNVLATIRSRVQPIPIYECSWEQIKASYRDVDEHRLRQLFDMYGGRVVYISDHLNNKRSLNSIEVAKQLFTVNTAERLTRMSEITDTRVHLLDICDGVTRVYQALLRSAIKKSDSKQLRHCISKLRRLAEIRSNIVDNGSLKLNASLLLGTIN